MCMDANFFQELHSEELLNVDTTFMGSMRLIVLINAARPPYIIFLDAAPGQAGSMGCKFKAGAYAWGQHILEEQPMCCEFL